MTPTQADIEKATEIIAELANQTNGAGDYGKGGIFENRFSPDVRRSDINSFLVDTISKALAAERSRVWEAALGAVKENGQNEYFRRWGPSLPVGRRDSDKRDGYVESLDDACRDGEMI